MCGERTHTSISAGTHLPLSQAFPLCPLRSRTQRQQTTEREARGGGGGEFQALQCAHWGPAHSKARRSRLLEQGEQFPCARGCCRAILASFSFTVQESIGTHTAQREGGEIKSNTAVHAANICAPRPHAPLPPPAAFLVSSHAAPLRVSEENRGGEGGRRGGRRQATADAATTPPPSAATNCFRGGRMRREGEGRKQRRLSHTHTHNHVFSPLLTAQTVHT